MGLEIRFTTDNISPAEVEFLQALLAKLNGDTKSGPIGTATGAAAPLAPSAPMPPVAGATTPVNHAHATTDTVAGTTHVAPVAPVSPDETESSATFDLNSPDADGLVWDERIHSSNKKRSAKNVWMRRRGVSDQMFHHVVAELRARPTAPAAPAAVPAIDPAGAFGPTAGQGDPGVPVAPPAPVVSNVVPMAPQVAPAPVAGAGPTFIEIMHQVQQAADKGHKIWDVLKASGIADATALINSQPNRDSAAAIIKTLG